MVASKPMANGSLYTPEGKSARCARRKNVSPLLTAALLSALALVLSSAAHGARLPIKTYTTADGLARDQISRIVRGLLWFCTSEGLLRFDGSRFVTYQVGDKDAPPGIEQILETSKGVYWIVTTGGMYRFDPSAPAANNTRNKDRPALNAKLMTQYRGVLCEDRSGNLWWGGCSLCRVEEKDGAVSLQKIELNLPEDPSGGFEIYAIREGRDGSLWLVTSSGLVRRLRDGREVLYSFAASPTDIARSVLEDRAGRIWFGRVSGIYVIKPETAWLNSMARRFFNGPPRRV